MAVVRILVFKPLGIAGVVLLSVLLTFISGPLTCGCAAAQPENGSFEHTQRQDDDKKATGDREDGDREQGTVAPAEGGTKEGAALQDGDESETTPADEFRAKLDGDDPIVLARALADLEDATQDPTAHGWIKKLIGEFLTPPKVANKTRTRQILTTGLVLQETPGEEILFAFMNAGVGTFQGDVEAAIATIATQQTARRLTLLKRSLRPENLRSCFPVVFRVLAPIDLREIINDTIEHLGELPEDATAPKELITDELLRLLRLETAPQDWAAWFTTNQTRLFQGILDRSEASLWKSSWESIKSQRSEARNFLVQSLAPRFSGTVRAPLALEALQGFIENLKSANGELTPEQRSKLLEPVVDALKTIYSSDQWQLSLRLTAVRRLGEMGNGLLGESTLLAEELSVVLRENILGIPQSTGPGYQLGVEAVRVAGLLKIAVGKQLDTVLDWVLSENRWDADRDELVVRLLEAEKRIGARFETVELLEKVFLQPVPDQGDVRFERIRQARELAVRVISREAVQGWETDDQKARVLGFYQGILTGDSSGVAEAAIITLGDLKLDNSIGVLRNVIDDRAKNPELAKQAVKAINNIGGLPAVQAFRTLARDLPPDEAELLDDVRKYAKFICAKDETLEHLRAYVLAGDERMPWFVSFLAETEIAALLQPSEVRGRSKDVWNNWIEIERQRCLALKESVDGLDDLAQEAAGYESLGRTAQAVLTFVAGLDDASSIPATVKPEFVELQSLSERRGRLAGHLAAKAFDECWQLLKTLGPAEGTDGDAEAFADTCNWLLNRLKKLQRDPTAEAPLLKGIRSFERHLDDDTKTLLNELQPSDGGDKPG